MFLVLWTTLRIYFDRWRAGGCTSNVLVLAPGLPVLVISASFQRFPTACALEFEKQPADQPRRSRDLIKTTLAVSRSLVNSCFQNRLL